MLALIFSDVSRMILRQQASKVCDRAKSEMCKIRRRHVFCFPTLDDIRADRSLNRFTNYRWETNDAIKSSESLPEPKILSISVTSGINIQYIV